MTSGARRRRQGCETHQRSGVHHPGAISQSVPSTNSRVILDTPWRVGRHRFQPFQGYAGVGFQAALRDGRSISPLAAAPLQTTRTVRNSSARSGEWIFMRHQGQAHRSSAMTSIRPDWRDLVAYKKAHRIGWMAHSVLSCGAASSPRCNLEDIAARLAEWVVNNPHAACQFVGLHQNPALARPPWRVSPTRRVPHTRKTTIDQWI